MTRRFEYFRPNVPIPQKIGTEVGTGAVREGNRRLVPASQWVARTRASMHARDHTRARVCAYAICLYDGTNGTLGRIESNQRLAPSQWFVPTDKVGTGASRCPL